MNYFKEAIVTIKNSRDNDERWDAITDIVNLSISYLFLALAIACLIGCLFNGHLFIFAMACLVMYNVVKNDIYSRHDVL